MSPKILLYHWQLKIYYELYRILSFIIDNAYWYCFCDSVPGCSQEHKFKGWCLNSIKFHKIFGPNKKTPVKIVKLGTTLYKDLKQIVDYYEVESMFLKVLIVTVVNNGGLN